MKEEQALAIDVGASNIRMALGDSEGRIIRKTSAPLNLPMQAGILRQVSMMISTLRVDRRRLSAVGIGSIGPLDIRTGSIKKGVNISSRKPIALVRPIEEMLDVKVVLLNDCVAAVVGEKAFGAGFGVENLVYVTISTGIGCGAYVDGHLLIGKDGNAHEIGHIVVDFEGRLTCGCGKIGHWEAYCSGKNIPRYACLLMDEWRNIPSKDDSAEPSILNVSNKSDITAKAIFDAARKGDSVAKKIVDRIALLNAAGFASIVNAYDPSLITVGGSVALNNPDLVLKQSVKHLSKFITNRRPKISITPLGEDAVLRGALACAIDPRF